MKYITIGFSKSKKNFAIGSMLIRAYQGFSSFSHCYIRMKVPVVPSDAIIHASEGKVLRMSGTQFDKKHEVVDEFKVLLTDAEHDKVRILMHEISGDDYSLCQNLGIFIVDLARLIGFNIKNPWTTGWNCSEFVMEIVKNKFPEQFSAYDQNTVTPIQVYKVMKKLKAQGLVS